jgi:hypothetical protein
MRERVCDAGGHFGATLMEIGIDSFAAVSLDTSTSMPVSALAAMQ